MLMWVAKLCQMLSSTDRARRWRLLANIERTTERLRRNREEAEHQGNRICQHTIKLNPRRQVEIAKDVQDY